MTFISLGKFKETFLGLRSNLDGFSLNLQNENQMFSEANNEGGTPYKDPSDDEDADQSVQDSESEQK